MTFDASELFLGFAQSGGRPAAAISFSPEFYVPPLGWSRCDRVGRPFGSSPAVLQHNPPLTNLAALHLPCSLKNGVNPFRGTNR
jgi:hypothetical protein